MNKLDTWELVYNVFENWEKAEAISLWNKFVSAEEEAFDMEDRIRDIPRDTSQEDRMAILNHAVESRWYVNFCESCFRDFLRETARSHNVEWDGN